MKTQYINTVFGVWQAEWTDTGLYELNFPQTMDKCPTEQLDEQQQELQKQLIAYCTGKKYNFTKIRIDFADYTDFAIDVLKTCQGIKHAHTDTYKGLAEKVCRDKAYRAVGSIMSRNRTPIIIPCHRVLGSSGKLCGFAGGLDVKQKLLNWEANK